MAGSKQIFLYRDDAGREKLLSLDESNTRALGFTPASVATGATLRLERTNGKERYINLQGQTADGKPVARRLIVPVVTPTGVFTVGGTLDLPVLTDGTNGTVELVEFSVTQAVGEAKKFARLTGDTGLDDGSQP